VSNLYLYLDLITLAGPLLLSFDKKVAFFKSWKPLFLGIITMMLIFIPWDVYFTDKGYWGFNPDYLCGFDILNLPIEEWLFFMVVPYACLFIVACVRAYFKWYLPQKIVMTLWLGLAILCAIVGIIYLDHAYTASAFLGCSGVLLLTYKTLNNSQKNLFLLSYLIILIPFLIINGVLTGTGIDSPIVWYNDSENLGIRLFTIPLDDVFYNLFMLLIVYSVYSKFMLDKITEKSN
jgi:lycopene cyclase domain-containing protein